MQQRPVRLGDIVDDYCPRERRITNHAVVAMIEDEVKQTRCTTCDAEHEYKQARIPPQRRKRASSGVPESAEAALRPRAAVDDDAAPEEVPPVDIQPDEPFAAPAEAPSAGTEPPPVAAVGEDEGPVHRRLIRATLPRPDGQMPERKEPDFTIRQSGFRGRGSDSHKNGHRGRHQMRAHGGSQQSHFGPTRHGSGHAPRPGSGQGPRHGAGGARQGSGPGHRPGSNRPGHPGGPRGNRPGSGPGRGGRKRGH